jgi:hypothetical protein
MERRCESLIRERYGYRGQCLRNATTTIEGHQLCTQHAQRALRRRVIWLADGEWFKVAKST